MKRRYIPAVLVGILCLLCLCCCGRTSGDADNTAGSSSATAADPPQHEPVYAGTAVSGVAGVPLVVDASYVCLVQEGENSYNSTLRKLVPVLSDACGGTIRSGDTGDFPEQEKEILLGIVSSRPALDPLYRRMEGYCADGIGVYMVAAHDGKILLCGDTVRGVSLAVSYFTEHFVSGEGIAMPEKLEVICAYDRAANTGAPLREEELAEEERAGTLYLDGRKLEGFSPDTDRYTVELEYGVPCPEVTAGAYSPRASVTVENVTGTTDGVARISVTAASGAVRTYEVAFRHLDHYTVSAKMEKARGGAGGIISLVHDDGDLATVRWLQERFTAYSEEYGVDLSVMIALIANRVYRQDPAQPYVFDPDCVIQEQADAWRELLESPYFSLGCHSYTHGNWGQTDSDGLMTREIVSAGQMLRDIFGLPVLTFVYPGFAEVPGEERYNELSMSYIARNYLAARFLTSGKVNPIGAGTDFVRVLAHGAYSGQAGLDAQLARIDEAVNGGWGVLFFHTVIPEQTAVQNITVDYAYMEQLFLYLIPYLQDGRLWCAPFEEAAKYVWAYEHSHVQAVGYADRIEVSLLLNEDAAFPEGSALDTAVLDCPVTVRVALPDGMTEPVCGGTALSCFSEEDVRYVYVDVAVGQTVTITQGA